MRSQPRDSLRIFPHNFLHILNLLQDTLLELALDLLALVICPRLAVKSHQSTQIELGSLQKFNLADVYLCHMLAPASYLDLTRKSLLSYVLQRVNALGRLLNLAADDLGNELRGELSEGAGGSLALDNINHLAANGTDLRRGGVGRLLDLVLAALGEADSEQANEVVVGCLDSNIGLNERLPLADERSQLVGCEVETVEVSQAALALDFVDAEANLAERVILILLEVGEGDLDDTSLQRIVRVLQTGGAVDEGLADTVQAVSFGIVRRSVDSRVQVTHSRTLKGLGACVMMVSTICDELSVFWSQFTLMEYQSLREKGSTVFFLRPFLPFESLLFLFRGKHV